MTLDTSTEPGWLADQLPALLAEDPFLRGMLQIFEDVANTVRADIASIPHTLDIGLTPPRFVAWLGSWVALPVPPGLPDERRRAVVRAAGTAWQDRGTARGLRRLLEAATGNEVRVEDGGGVFPRGQAPRDRPPVLVDLDGLGDLSEHQVLRLVAAAVPAHVVCDVRLRGQPLR